MPFTPARIVFLDRDGTIIEEPPDEQVDSLQKLRFLPGTIAGLRSLVREGYELVMVSNQDHLGTDRYPQRSFDEVQDFLMTVLEGEGIRFREVLICPHGPDDVCSCRKPKAGLVEALLLDGTIDTAQSFMVGDRETDVLFAQQIGVRSIRLDPSGTAPTQADIRAATFQEACTVILRHTRRASVRRETTETIVDITVALDGTGTYAVSTGLGFFDHMLSLLIKHAAIDASVSVTGDLHVDEHHTIEDTGLALGDALRQALNDRRGTERYGFVLPMDEAQAQVAVDLGGRPFLVFDARFTREKVGDVPTELFEDFFRALADGLRANVQITAHGRNDHHIAEACFKGVGRCLRQAVSRREDQRDVLPTTKGIL